MKRQHPAVSNWFWCPKCQTWKVKAAFGNRKLMTHGVASECSECHNARYWGDREQSIIKLRKSRQENLEKYRVYQRVWHKEHPEMRPSIKLSDAYIKGVIKNSQPNPDYSPEMIELVRQRIIMKRTLSEFKKWRKANESNYADVYGKQCTNEENHEGRVQA